MNFNLHTHTYLCRHASETPEEYVLAAINRGLKQLGFSDHIPYDFGEINHFLSGFRMLKEETETYVSGIRKLKEKYKDKIEIYVGYEAEFYPKHFDKTVENIEKYGYDYLILGQHHTNNEYDGVYSGARTEDPEILKQYVLQVTEGIKTGKFTYVAHPDLINFADRKSKIYLSEMEKLCRTALDYNVPLEFNLRGVDFKSKYPCREFFEIVKEVGNDVVMGLDAHSIREINNTDPEERALEILSELNITPINNKNADNYIK